MRRETRIKRAAAALAWGKRLDDAAAEIGVDRETLMDWMRCDEFKAAWEERFSEYVRYLQGACAASLEDQVRGDDDKIRAGAATAIMKLGERLETDGGETRVYFAMPSPGEANGEARE